MDAPAVVESVLELFPLLLGVVAPADANLPVEGVQQRKKVLEDERFQVRLKVGHRSL